MNIVPIKNIDELKVNHPNLDTVYKGFIVDDFYRVLIARTGKYKHLRIRRLDDKPVSSFSDMQNLKNHFLGKEVEGIQVFPKISNYVNNTNTYHIFSWDGMDLPNLKEMYKYI